MKRERFACNKCPAFYECEKQNMAVTAGGYETRFIDGRNVILCRPAPAWGRKKTMDQFAFYCMATTKGKKIANKADYTGNVPKWCPLLDQHREEVN